MSGAIPTIVFVLMAQMAGTRTSEWYPHYDAPAFLTLQQCLDKKAEIARDPEKSKDAHDFTMPLKCVRYRIAK
jgi:hypothetical protein